MTVDTKDIQAKMNHRMDFQSPMIAQCFHDAMNEAIKIILYENTENHARYDGPPSFHEIVNLPPVAIGKTVTITNNRTDKIIQIR